MAPSWMALPHRAGEVEGLRGARGCPDRDRGPRGEGGVGGQDLHAGAHLVLAGLPTARLWVPPPAGSPSSTLLRVGSGCGGSQSWVEGRARRASDSRREPSGPAVRATPRPGGRARCGAAPRSRGRAGRCRCRGRSRRAARWRGPRPRGRRTVTSATAGPASGLVSSSTELCRVPAPTPVNQASGLGCGQSTAASRRSPNLAPISPGARSPSPSATTGPSPACGSAAGTHRHRRVLPRRGHGHFATHVRLTGGDVRPPAPSGADGQATDAELSVVGSGGRTLSTGSCGWTSIRVPTVRAGSSRARTAVDVRPPRRSVAERRPRVVLTFFSFPVVGAAAPRPPRSPRPCSDQQPDPQPGVRAVDGVRVDGSARPARRGWSRSSALAWVQPGGRVEHRGHVAVGGRGQHDVLDPRGRPASAAAPAPGRRPAAARPRRGLVVGASSAAISSSPTVMPSSRSTE